jgi:predicted permease
MITTILCFGIIWFSAEIFLKDKTMIGSFVQGSFRGSMAVLGIAFIQNIYGNAGLAPQMIVAAVPLYNIFSVIVLTMKGMDQEGQRKERIKSAFFGICTNPIILGILAGLPFALFDITIPGMVLKSLNNFANMATPLALIAIGAGFELHKALGKINVASAATVIKLILQPAIFLPIAVMMGFRDQAMVALLIMLGADTDARRSSRNGKLWLPRWTKVSEWASLRSRIAVIAGIRCSIFCCALKIRRSWVFSPAVGSRLSSP